MKYMTPSEAATKRNQAAEPMLSREGGGTYDLRTEHVREEDNYGHCETGVSRDGTRMRKNQVSREGKNKLRLIFGRDAGGQEH
ncbi:MAG: hypothetical protein LAP87_09550 [Acidobacteriia bacterium]|nr:hypothetical protein [Terriglobia bacterium]